MSQHTPGPWEPIPPKKRGKHWSVGARGTLGGNGPNAGVSVLWNLAYIDNGAPGDTLNTEEANARLIAAAPDLLAIAKRIADLMNGTYSPLDVLENLNSIGDEARAALAKAEPPDDGDEEADDL